MAKSGRPSATAFFDEATFTVSYVVGDPESKACAVVDPVLDYEPVSGRTNTASADMVVAFIRDNGLDVQWILETHVHADHLSAAAYLQQQVGGQIGVGSQITVVQDVFGKVFNAGTEFQRDGSQFDRLFADDDALTIGSIEGKVWHTPGHTPACVSYLIGDAVFVGDTLFMPDFGTARCDFPGGDARQLYASIRRILSLPDKTRLYRCHDYKAPGRDEYAWETSVVDERRHNVHVRDGIDEETFVEMRTARDAELGLPRLILPSVQVNMRAGRMPPAEDNGTRYLKIPIDTL